jgi:threonine dehydrogenase-like Zn-dependent dehydrogenase
MLAWWFRPAQMQIERVPTERLQAGELLVAPLRVGICGSDLDLQRGIRPLGTCILGLDGVAEIVATGSATSQYAVVPLCRWAARHL